MMPKMVSRRDVRDQGGVSCCLKPFLVLLFVIALVQAVILGSIYLKTGTLGLFGDSIILSSNLETCLSDRAPIVRRRGRMCTMSAAALWRGPALVGRSLAGPTSSPSMALVVPYRPRTHDQWSSVERFVDGMHLFFAEHATEISYRIVIVEQTQCLENLFNRGKLLNVGVDLSENRKSFGVQGFDYYIFHDMDEFPQPQVDYSFPEMPTHMMVARKRYNYRPNIGAHYTGGVVKINTKQFIQVNGYSNNFWGWGREDIDFGARITNAGLKLRHLDPKIGRYDDMEGEHGTRDKRNYGGNLKVGRENDQHTDGYNNVRYRLVSEYHSEKYSHYMVDLGGEDVVLEVEPTKVPKKKRHSLTDKSNPAILARRTTLLPGTVKDGAKLKTPLWQKIELMPKYGPGKDKGERKI